MKRRKLSPQLISEQLGGDNVGRRLVVAVDAEVNMAGIVEHADFGLLCGRRSLEWLALTEISDGRRSLPNRIVESSVQAGRMLGPDRRRSTSAGAWNFHLC